MAEFDPGPPDSLAEHFAQVPAPSQPEDFWLDWGPIFYRGRLDGSARLLCVGSDPGPTERIPGRCLVGNAGQRVQGFLTKLGLTRAYVCVNAWAYAVHPNRAQDEQQRLDEPAELAWRNELYDLVTGPELQAIVAFGGMAQRAVELWDSRPHVPVHDVPHPSSRDPDKLLNAWRAAVADCAGSSRPIRTATTPAPTTAPRSRSPTTPRSRGATSRSASRPSWATTPGRASAASRAPSRDRSPTTGTR